MSLDQWRSEPFPGAGIAVRPVCSDQGADAQRLGLQATASGDAASEIVSTYAFTAVDGSRDPVPITGGFYARQARYVFRAGRLSEISFTTSPDAFRAMTARIDAQLGQPHETVRDMAHVRGVSFPRVRMHWSGPAGTVTLVDPVGDTTLMKLDYTASEQARVAAPPTKGSAPPRLSKG
jgi:hypothetical protein